MVWKGYKISKEEIKKMKINVNVVDYTTMTLKELEKERKSNNK